jgi:hypothetical protein
MVPDTDGFVRRVKIKGENVKNTDRDLVKQMIRAGRYSAIMDFMPAVIDADSKEMIERMGPKWVCHPDNRVKRLDVPLEILKGHQSKVLRKR